MSRVHTANTLEPGSPLSDRLSQATRAAHRLLDHHPVLMPLTKTPLSQAEYVRALAALHGPQALLESLVVVFASPQDFPPRLADLAADLEDLGARPLPLRHSLPAPSSQAGQVGCMYVIEGSNLGGRIIARCLANSLPQAPRRFFAVAPATDRWQRFWAWAEQRCPIGEAEVAVASALATFSWYRQHLDDCLANG